MDLKAVIEYSEGFTRNRLKIAAFMKDISPEEDIRIRNILLNVYESGIAKELFLRDKILREEYQKYISRLEKEYGMTTESSVEALNSWIDICIKKGAGDKYVKSVIDNRRKKYNTPSSFRNNAITNKLINVMETIYEDENIKIVFIKLKRIKNKKGEDIISAFLGLENYSNEDIIIALQDIEIGGYINNPQVCYEINKDTKEVQCEELIYLDKIPGKLDYFNSVECHMVYCSQDYDYDEFGEAGVRRSGPISLSLDNIEE